MAILRYFQVRCVPFKTQGLIEQCCAIKQHIIIETKKNDTLDIWPKVNQPLRCFTQFFKILLEFETWQFYVDLTNAWSTTWPFYDHSMVRQLLINQLMVIKRLQFFVKDFLSITFRLSPLMSRVSDIKGRQKQKVWGGQILLPPPSFYSFVFS